VDTALGWWNRMEGGNVSDVSEEYSASIITAEMINVGK
jgi:hypothetical protein